MDLEDEVSAVLGHFKDMFADKVKEKMAEQKKKLMQTLAVCVNGLSDIGEIVPAVRALGQRHVGYRVKDEHYETVGAALLWTLEQGLGSGVWESKPGSPDHLGEQSLVFYGSWRFRDGPPRGHVDLTRHGDH